MSERARAVLRALAEKGWDWKAGGGYTLLQRLSQLADDDALWSEPLVVLAEDEALQRRLFEVERDAGWGETTFGEECAHLHEEVSEAFRAYRMDHGCVAGLDNGKPVGVAAELADVVIGCFYIAEQYGFDLMAAVEQKSAYNATRNYQAEGRQLHPPPSDETWVDDGMEPDPRRCRGG